MRNALIGIGVAAGAALLAIDPTIYGIELWKIVLGVVGLGLMREASRERKS
jgi:hypothetical protein